MTTESREKILLVLLPFWTPQIPPLGIACLKSFLGGFGYDVKTVDVNTHQVFNRIYNTYFDLLKEFIPKENRGNFINIGHDVLRNQMLAHLNRKEKKEYIQLVKILVKKNYYCHIASHHIVSLDNVLTDFYQELEKYLLDLLAQEKPSVFGLSLYSGNLPASLFAFKLAKEKYPHIITVAGGGIFADQLNKASLNFVSFREKYDYIQHIIIGEGEILFLKLLRGELPESQRVYTRKDIHGETLDLSTVNIPDFSDFEPPLYPYMASYVSRSCPYQCAFCSETVQWGKYRKKNVKKIVREFQELYEKYGSQLFLLGDSLLNPAVSELAGELITSQLRVYWDGYLRADAPACDIENTLLWRRGGFYRARLGLESGSPRVLKTMKKMITPGQIKAAVQSLANAGIKTTTYWVIGHPGETETDFLQTLELIKELKNYIYEAECNPFNYHLSGQMKSSEWAKTHKSTLLYPEKLSDMLPINTWTMNCQPTREETYQRVFRFVRHCKSLGIPNPYSLNEIHHADERWKRLHKNSVPSLLEFKNTSAYLDDSRKVKKFSVVKNIFQCDDGDFDI